MLPTMEEQVGVIGTFGGIWSPSTQDYNSLRSCVTLSLLSLLLKKKYKKTEKRHTRRSHTQTLNEHHHGDI